MGKKKTKDNFAPLFHFEEIEHTADLALRVRGRDLKELLESAAMAMAHLLCEDSFVSDDPVEKLVDIRADDAEGLLVEWLSELVFLVEVESFIFQGAEIQTVSEMRLRAKIFGKIARELKLHIKAVTYHNLKIVKADGWLEAVIVFDI